MTHHKYCLLTDFYTLNLRKTFLISVSNLAVVYHLSPLPTCTQNWNVLEKKHFISLLKSNYIQFFFSWQMKPLSLKALWAMAWFQCICSLFYVKSSCNEFYLFINQLIFIKKVTTVGKDENLKEKICRNYWAQYTRLEKEQI